MASDAVVRARERLFAVWHRQLDEALPKHVDPGLEDNCDIQVVLLRKAGGEVADPKVTCSKIPWGVDKA